MDRSRYVNTLLYTPKTPTMQRIRQQFNLQSFGHLESENDGGNDSLDGLLKYTWNIFGVSSLFGFEYGNERQLKLYGKLLREEIASMLPQQNVTYDVKFLIDESIDPRPTVTDPPAIRIEIYAKSLDKKDDEKCIYTGILISWGTPNTEIDHKKSVKLPLLLCRGTKSTMTAVHNTLGNMFDSIIMALPATEDDLKWLVPVILQGSDADKMKGQVRFEYKIPGLPTTNTIAVTYHISTLAKLWTVIHDNDTETDVDNGILLNHVERFHEILQRQMSDRGGIQLGLGILNKISLPSVIIAENRMKVVTSESLSKVLLYFNEKAIEVLHILSLDSTVSTDSVV